MEYIWMVVVIGGPLLLIGVMIWAKRHNRMSRKEWEQSEEAVHDLRKKLDREDRRRE